MADGHDASGPRGDGDTAASPDSAMVRAYCNLVATGSVTPDPEQAAAIGLLDDLARRLVAARRRTPLGFFARHLRANPSPVRGLYLFGPAGRGKSMLMDLFFDNVAVQPKRRVHFHAFMQEVHGGIAAARGQGLDEPVQHVADRIAEGAALLCFDEMEITDITDAMLVGRLMERLFDRGVVVVTTSNAHPDELYKGGWNRDIFVPFIDLLKARLDLVELASPVDHRRNRARQEVSYITPLGAATDGAIDAVWQKLRAGRPEVPLAIRAYGHENVFPRSVGRALRCDFADLCGRPFGPADYLALVDRIDVLVLERVPVLGPKRNNEARRFITLIDTLYEAKVRLVVSAAAAPDALYTEGDGAFEFRRTASRLEEMRSVDWWRDTGDGQRVAPGSGEARSEAD